MHWLFSESRAHHRTPGWRHSHQREFLGGGVIAAELGQALVRLGTDVTIVDRGPRILRVVDGEVAELAIAALQEDGIRILTNSRATASEARCFS